jgi:hypothetical protein
MDEHIHHLTYFKNQNCRVNQYEKGDPVAAEVKLSYCQHIVHIVNIVT